ncbi:outer membrane protein [Mesorhizobium abyssinicae]|uniref:outer membrane protein n=2 Tax=Mesorhizobium abyssinicae TaxID=1209958 RepID=UPI003CEA2EFD
MRRLFREVNAIWSSDLGRGNSRVRRMRRSQFGQSRQDGRAGVGGLGLDRRIYWRPRRRGLGGTSFSDPYGPSIYGDVVSTPVFLAGGQIGYNWQRDRLVFGAELDAGYAVSDGTNSCFAFSGTAVIDTCHAGPDSFSTATARVGYTFGPRGQMLAYVKAGVWQNNRGEIANNNEFLTQDSPGFGRQTTHFDYGRFGWSLGAGVEQALSPDWSVKFEYDYMGFSGTRLTTPSTVMRASIFCAVRAFHPEGADAGPGRLPGSDPDRICNGRSKEW